MFFGDPVSTFINLRRAVMDGAKLYCVARRSPVANLYMTTAEYAAASLLPNLLELRPDAPGQFSFADRHRVSSTLAAGGGAEIDIRPIDMDCTLPERELASYFSRLSPAGMNLGQTYEQTRGPLNPSVPLLVRMYRDPTNFATPPPAG